MDNRQGCGDTPRPWLPRRSWGDRVQLVLFLAGAVFVILFTPFTQVFSFESFEALHGGFKLDFAIYMVGWIVGKSLYLYFLRRRQAAAELTALKDALRHGRVKRMPFAARWLFILSMLGLVIVGWIAPEPHRARILALSLPLFLLLCAVGLHVIIHPGEALLPDPSDELLAFFKTRMLQAGYVASIASLAALYLTYLFAPAYVGLLLPAVLTACVLVPSLLYNRLDRQAERDG